MKIERNKLLFITAIALVILFIIGYAVVVLGESENDETQLSQPEVPEIPDEQKQYSSKLDAVNDVKEMRESNAPSIYDESLLDSTGLFDPSFQEKERERIVDSIYAAGRINYETGEVRTMETKPLKRIEEKNSEAVAPNFSNSHQEFFDVTLTSLSASNPLKTLKITDDFIMVEVDGEQTVKTDNRLELRLAVDVIINGDSVPRNSLVYGFVSFKSNRVFIKITNINHKPVDLKAYDLLDGNEGIYVRNSFANEATREVLEDVVQDINIPGVPQVGGIKQVFRRNNRNVKVTIYNQYQLILKPTL